MVKRNETINGHLKVVLPYRTVRSTVVYSLKCYFFLTKLVERVRKKYRPFGAHTDDASNCRRQCCVTSALERHLKQRPYRNAVNSPSKVKYHFPFSCCFRYFLYVFNMTRLCLVVMSKHDYIIKK